MYQALLSLLRTPRILTSLMLLAGTGAAFIGFHPSTPLFPSTEGFVLFGSESIVLEEGTQVSSGDLGTNNKLDIAANVLVSGNLFGKSLFLKEGALINGTANYHTLKTATSGQIFGAATGDVHLPIVNLTTLPAINVGTSSLTAIGTSTTLSSGNYANITLSGGSTLTLTGGTYNLRSLVLKGTSTLLYVGTTTLNIQWKLRGYDRVAILPANNQTTPDDLTINYWGTAAKQEKNLKEDDDAEIDASCDNEQERRDWHKGNIGRPVLFGAHSFLNGRINAPKASVTIGKESTARGQVLARKIRVGKNGILSRTEFFATEPDQTKVVTDGNTQYLANEIILQLTDGTTLMDATAIASSVGGTITGNISELNLYKIQVHSTTGVEAQALVEQIIAAHNPLVTSVTLNFIMDIL